MAALHQCIFSNKSGRRSSVGPEILAFVSHCSANFQPILDCFTSNFKLKYEDSENIKDDRVDTIVFNLHQIKHWAFFWDTRYLAPGSRRRLHTILQKKRRRWARGGGGGGAPIILER